MKNLKMDETTFHESFMQVVEGLPTEFRRDFDLIKELERQCIDLNRDLVELEKNHIEKVKRIKLEMPMIAKSNSTTSGSADVAGTASNETAGKKQNSINDHPELVKSLEAINTLRNRIKSLSSEKTSITISMAAELDRYTRKLDGDLSIFEMELRAIGHFDSAMVQGAEPGTDVCIRPNLYSIDMILGRVIQYHPDVGAYDILDCDESGKRYHLPDNQVILLDGDPSHRKMTKGETVYAVYPDTTAFYLATITLAPRKSVAGTVPTVQVQFQGDEGEDGTTPQRTVPLRHVVRPPPWTQVQA